MTSKSPSCPSARAWGARLREQGCTCNTVTVGIRDKNLIHYDRQTKLPRPTHNTMDLWDTAVALYQTHHTLGAPVRSLSVKAGGLAPAEDMEQLSLFPEEQKAQRRGAIDRTVDAIRAKYGYFSIRRVITQLDPALDLDAKGEHIIHPIGFLGTLNG